MDKKKKGNIFKKSIYSVSTAFDQNYNTILKASHSLNSIKNKNESNF